ncbi:hypothetical protein [Lactococcus protaetiae]|uniref:PTS EIIB type-3 domain-containing protein n=1 Tax=Lactococcus protaetiae TaxID=2592653 RepID=A0A514Z5R9_9LACT|nr:hypothetical protein [Lactococcus protaetiae]QDK69942.1 hypothetical protein FLP15_00615 [Lactococcus protaetiae]
MFIYIACSQGMTASLFCHRIVGFISEKKEEQSSLTAVYDDVDHVFKKRREYGVAYDLIFAYGGIDEIRSYTAFDFGSLFDVILVAPSEFYKTDEKSKMLADYPTIVKDLPSLLYGRMNADKGYDLLLGELINLDLERGYDSSVLTTTKSIDKDLEIYVGGNGSKDLYFRKIFEFLVGQGIRCYVSHYSMEELYEFKPEVDFDIRFIFGPISVLTERDFERVARRIDAFLVNDDSYFALKRRRKWMKAYKIPWCLYNDNHLKRKIRKGQFAEEEAKIWDFIMNIQMRSEDTSDLIVENFASENIGLNNNDDDFNGCWG